MSSLLQNLFASRAEQYAGLLVPEIKAVWTQCACSALPMNTFFQILGGYVFDAFLTPWTLLIKALGLALAVASGLSLGKEVGESI